MQKRNEICRLVSNVPHCLDLIASGNGTENYSWCSLNSFQPSLERFDPRGNIQKQSCSCAQNFSWVIMTVSRSVVYMPWGLLGEHFQNLPNTPLLRRCVFYITVIRCICEARSASCWNILLKGGSSCRGLMSGLEYKPSASLIASLTLRVNALT